MLTVLDQIGISDAHAPMLPTGQHSGPMTAATPISTQSTSLVNLLQLGAKRAEVWL